MAATKYQILYRYTNPNTNQFIKNNDDVEYNPIIELFHDKHKIMLGNDDEKLEATKQKADLIINGNNTSNKNYNMLFKFTGTKRINKKVWTESSIGYVIRDIEPIKNLITRAVDGDWSGNYLLVEGSTFENGVVVSRTNPVTSTISITKDDAENKLFFKDLAELDNTITHKTIAQLVSNSYLDYSTLNTYSDNRYGGSGKRDINIKVGADFAVKNIRYYSSYYYTDEAHNAITQADYDALVASGCQGFTSVTIKPTQVKTYEIPAHYEEIADYPYIISDTYEKVEQSPWFVLSTHASLSSALEKVKPVVKALGLENVKLVKVVPTDQRVKIV